MSDCLYLVYPIQSILCRLGNYIQVIHSVFDVPTKWQTLCNQVKMTIDNPTHRYGSYTTQAIKKYTDSFSIKSKALLETFF